MLIVYIIGSTASGKTKLSLNLGLQNYEIISCDSMQLYKEANIMTAKATEEEQNKVKHHGINLLDLDQEGFNRKQWRDITLKKIDELHQKNIIPVLVGGTHYYIESILFQQDDNDNEQQLQQIQQNIDLDGKDPYEYLKEIDPLAAEKFHPNDNRRILNSIKYYQNTGLLPSQKTDHHSDDCKLRNNNFLILWPKWKKTDDLKIKVTERIEEMLNEDGIKEILNIFEKLDGKQLIGGVLQSIGYRQFAKAYQYYKENNLQYPQIDDIFKQYINEGKEVLINDTMHYTKKQIQWIKNRILCNSNIDIIANRLFLLEFDSSQTFNQQVIQPSQKIYELFCQLNNENKLQDSLFNISNNNIQNVTLITSQMIEKYKQNYQQKTRTNWKKKYCELCQKWMNGPIEEDQHNRSRFHRINIMKNEEKVRKMKRID